MSRERHFCHKGSFIFVEASFYDQLATILWEVTNNQMDWTPGKEEGNRFLPAVFLPFSFSGIH